MNSGPTTHERKSDVPKKTRFETTVVPLAAELLVPHLCEYRVHHQQQPEGNRQRDGADPECVEAIVQARDQRAEPETGCHRHSDPERQKTVERRQLR